MNYVKYTAKEIKIVADMWDGSTLEQIATAVGRDKVSIQYIAGQIRKAGFPLARKTVERKMKLTDLIKQTLGTNA